MLRSQEESSITCVSGGLARVRGQQSVASWRSLWPWAGQWHLPPLYRVRAGRGLVLFLLRPLFKHHFPAPPRKLRDQVWL